MIALAAALALLLASPALAQVGVPNPAVDLPPPDVLPFGSAPHPFNNPHPMMPGAGPGTAATRALGSVVRYIDVAPQPVLLSVWVPVPDGVPPRYETQYTVIPGYRIAETTTGFVYPERWTVEQPNRGVYVWRRLPAEFRPK